MLNVSVSPEVFKIVDPRVDKLRQGKMSAEQFSQMVGPDDPFVLIDGVVHALSEKEFYASRAVIPVNAMSEVAFSYVMDMKDLGFMHKADRDYVEAARKDLPHCSACRYKRYKDEISRLAKKYNIQVPVDDKAEALFADKAVYPEVTSEVAPVVSVLHRNLFHVDMPKRRACIDCVEKHVSQAYVLSAEVACGYPEHMALVIAHLGEALDEMPPDANALKDTLMFCMAKTKKDKKPFVPRMLLSLINMVRAELGRSEDEDQDSVVDENASTMSIEIDDEVKVQLSLLPDPLLKKIRRYLMDAMETAGNGNGEPDRLHWEGCLACASECLAYTAPAVACMLRNRRLLFIGDIRATAKGEYSFYDIVDEIDRCSAMMNKKS